MSTWALREICVDETVEQFMGGGGFRGYGSGIYFFHLPVKQGLISAAHTDADINATLEAVEISFTAIQCER